MEKPATPSLNQPPGARLYSPVATGTVGTGLHRSLLLSYGRHQIRKDALTDVCASQERRADGRPPPCRRVTVTQGRFGNGVAYPQAGLRGWSATPGMQFGVDFGLEFFCIQLRASMQTAWSFSPSDSF